MKLPLFAEALLSIMFLLCNSSAKFLSFLLRIFSFFFLKHKYFIYIFLFVNVVCRSCFWCTLHADWMSLFDITLFFVMKKMQLFCCAGLPWDAGEFKVFNYIYFFHIYCNRYICIDFFLFCVCRLRFVFGEKLNLFYRLLSRRFICFRAICSISFESSKLAMLYLFFKL